MNFSVCAEDFSVIDMWRCDVAIFITLSNKTLKPIDEVDEFWVKPP